MKLIYHHRTRAEDAQGIHIKALCQAFVALGHEVKMVALVREAKPKQPSAEVRKNAHRMFGIAIPPLLYELMALAYNLPAFFALAWAILRFKPDFIYERYALSTFAGLLAAKVFRKPFILEVNAPLSLEMKQHDRLIFERLAQWIEDWLCRNATKTIVVSTPMRETFERRGIGPEHFVVMPNGVDRAEFNPGVSGADVRRQYELDGAFVVGFVGWIRPWHGVDMMLDALASLQDELPELHLLIVGDGPALPDLKQQARALNIESRVRFTGPVSSDAVARHIAAMDVAVQPDVTEYASPIKLFEYLAMGKAVIAPAKANISEIVTQGETALLFAPRDTAMLAAHMRTLCHDRARVAALGVAGSRLIDARGYHWQGNARRVIDLVRTRGAQADFAESSLGAQLREPVE